MADKKFPGGDSLMQYQLSLTGPTVKVQEFDSSSVASLAASVYPFPPSIVVESKDSFSSSVDHRWQQHAASFVRTWSSKPAAIFVLCLQ